MSNKYTTYYWGGERRAKKKTFVGNGDRKTTVRKTKLKPSAIERPLDKSLLIDLRLANPEKVVIAKNGLIIICEPTVAQRDGLREPNTYHGRGDRHRRR